MPSRRNTLATVCANSSWSSASNTLTVIVYHLAGYCDVTAADTAWQPGAA
jgi:hypothetical protein